MTVPSTTTWKIENGKWVWYNDVKVSSINPLDLSSVLGPAPAAAAPKNNDEGTGGLPKDLDEKAIAAAAKGILQQVSVDKKEVTLATDKPSEDKVVFHNGMPGSVQLELSAPEIPGLHREARTIERESWWRRPGGVSLPAGRFIGRAQRSDHRAAARPAHEPGLRDPRELRRAGFRNAKITGHRVASASVEATRNMVGSITDSQSSNILAGLSGSIQLLQDQRILSPNS